MKVLLLAPCLTVRRYARRVGEIVVVRDGFGPEVLLVHGGAGPRTTWGALAPLADRWTLAYVHRRGYPPSPPPQQCQDFEVDALDLAPLLVGRPHVVAHSYGALGALIAAAAAPGSVRSLTLIEPPLHYLVPDDPEVARLERIGDAVLTHGMDMDPAELREFLHLAGAPVGDGPLPENVVAGVRRAQGGRPTSEAHPQLDAIRDARRPSARRVRRPRGPARADLRRSGGCARWRAQRASGRWSLRRRSTGLRRTA
ncbi:alpha/beta fold hydrolase [Actinomadura madurae]|uniref:alpha/beta fold hydrolase n=1 Tax=Actinomadura madurae TaxID=1993 RepID=UPI003555C103